MALHEFGEVAIQRACGGIQGLLVKVCAVAGVVFRQLNEGAAADAKREKPPALAR